MPQGSRITYHNKFEIKESIMFEPKLGVEGIINNNADNEDVFRSQYPYTEENYKRLTNKYADAGTNQEDVRWFFM